MNKNINSSLRAVKFPISSIVLIAQLIDNSIWSLLSFCSTGTYFIAARNHIWLHCYTKRPSVVLFKTNFNLFFANVKALTKKPQRDE